MITIRAADGHKNVHYIRGTIGGAWTCTLANGIPTSLPAAGVTGKMPDVVLTEIALRQRATADECLTVLRRIVGTPWQFEIIDSGDCPAEARIARLEADKAALLAACRAACRQAAAIEPLVKSLIESEDDAEDDRIRDKITDASAGAYIILQQAIAQAEADSTDAPAKPDAKPRIAVIIQDGQVDAVYSDSPGLPDVFVVNCDPDEDADIYQVPDEQGGSDAVSMFTQGVTCVTAERIDAIVAAYEAGPGSDEDEANV